MVGRNISQNSTEDIQKVNDYKIPTEQNFSLNFLVADDQLSTRNKFKNTINRIWENANIILTSTAEETIETIVSLSEHPSNNSQNSKENEIDILLLDLDFGYNKTSGYDVLEYLNETGRIQNIIVIVISSLDEVSSTKRSLELGAFDFISKERIETEDGKLLFEARVNHGIQVHFNKRRLKQSVIAEIAKEKVEQEALLSVMATLLSTHNQETGGHVMRVQEYTRIILNKLNEKGLLPEELDIDAIVHATALHDVGKIKVPTEILNKPGSFTDEEYEQMKSHSYAGYKILSDEILMYADNDVLKYAKEIALHHHESYHGTGYPDGLKEDEIPIYIQAVSLADSFDAVREKRCYKDAAGGHEEVIARLKEPYRGSQLPLYSETLLAILDEVSDELKAASERDLKDFEIDQNQIANDIVNKLFSL